jgi:hypothetical protein
MASINDLAGKIISLSQNIKREQEELEVLKTRLQQYFDKKEKNKIEYSDSTLGSYIISKVERLNIDYNVDALDKKLDKEVFNEILIKEYTVADIKTLTKLIKNAGIPAMHSEDVYM